MQLKKPNKNLIEIGYVHSFFSGVAKIKGLPQVFLHEVLTDEDGEPIALVIGFAEDFVEALFFNNNPDVEKPVFRSFKTISIKISDKILGRVVDGLGRPLDGFGVIEGSEREIFSQAPPIIDRQSVSVPLTTGIKIIDATLPIGRGQRELIIGDRKLGKSTLAIDIVLNQKDSEPPVYCIYVLCGQKKQQLIRLLKILNQHASLLYTTVVASLADSSFADLYLAPFVGMAIAEYFRDQGKDALVVFDDLSKHAKAYRDIALLLEHAPGREAYPGDIFSLHAGLLERAGRLSAEHGGGSITALPIIETQEGDITSFIPTNIISITDGQIYLERGLFQKGFIPAVNVGLSVSRIGSQAQPKALKQVVSGIRLALAQHKQLQKLSQLETVVSDQAKKSIHRGELILELLKQKKHTKVTAEEQTILFYAVEEGFFDDLESENWADFQTFLLELLRNRYSLLLHKIKGGNFDNQVKKEIQKIITDFKQEFLLG